MRKQLLRLVSLIVFIILSVSVPAQQNFWSDISLSNRGLIKQKFTDFGKVRTLSLNEPGLNTYLKKAPLEFSGPGANDRLLLALPMPDGSFQLFAVQKTLLFEPALAQAFPGIETWGGQGVDDPGAIIKLDFTPQGFHAMILSAKTGVTYINPVSQGGNTYISFAKKDATPPDFMENIISSKKKQAVRTEAPLPQQCLGDTLFSYRIAVACTGEYARAVAGANATTAQVMGAITTTINRVNGIFETEAAIRLRLVNDNNKIVFLTPDTDPFMGNNDAAVLIDESQRVIDSLIGSANYDVGHTFSTGAGGLASLGVVCINGQKASGVTGNSRPTGDAYDVDFVTHEIGHQFGAQHTFNATTDLCQGNGEQSTNAEPGSGVTIMAYAGICGSVNNLQANSIPYFHAISFDEIRNYTRNGRGFACAAKTATGNAKPTVNAGADYTIPRSTPFVVMGTATDPNDNILTYSWEQVDVGGPFGNWNKPVAQAPLFRSFVPANSPIRYFPKLSDVLNNTTTIGEILPDYARTISLRLTARDNRAGGGGICYDHMQLTVAGNSGPFVITEPNTNVTWMVGNFERLRWNVANTNIAPVNCSKVTIELSTDGGLTYPIVLRDTTDNDGEEEVIVPDFVTNTARVRIRALENVFYDVSNTNLTIAANNSSGFTFSYPEPVLGCSGGNVGTVIYTNALNGYAQPITLSATGNPAGTTVEFSGNPIMPGSSDSFRITGNIPAGIYTITITGTSGSISRSRDIQFVIGGPSAAPLSTTPANSTTGVLLNPTFVWRTINGASSYNLSVSTTSDFSAAVQSFNNLTDTTYKIVTPLAENTQYYWRVAGNNLCGSGPASATAVFKTALAVCADTVYSGDVPKTIEPSVPNIVTSGLNIPTGGTIADVDVVGVKITHNYLNDIMVNLQSPAGTSVVLFENKCSSNSNATYNFNDEAASANFPCPANGTINLRPLQALSAFDGQSSTGTWTLSVSDRFPDDGGSLTAWGLRICLYTATPLPVNWLTFTGTINERNTVTLNWSTASELNNSHYDVERSSNGSTFVKVGALPAGNQSASMQQYIFNDETPGSGIAYYRLKQVDKDGSFQYSQIVRLHVANPIDKISVYPNPAKTQSFVRFNSDMQQVQVQLHDLGGRVVYSRNMAGVKAGQGLTIPVNNLSKGFYLLKITSVQNVFTSKLLVE